MTRYEKLEKIIFTESDIIKSIEKIWNLGSCPTVLYLNPQNMREFNNYTGIRIYRGDMPRSYNTVNFYESDFGLIRVVTSNENYVEGSGGEIVSIGQ